MNFGDLQTLVAFWLDDPNFGYYPIATVKTIINNAQREVQKMLLQSGENWYMQPSNSTTVLGQNEYVLPSDFLVAHRLELVLSGTAPNENIVAIPNITLNQQDLLPNGTGTPEGFYIKKNRIVIYPACDTSGLTLRLYYSALVQDMTNQTDVPDVPTQYQEMIAVLSTLDGLYKDGRDPGPFLQKKSYYETLMKEAAENRDQSGPRMVVQTSDDWGILF
jgi:hypothetical protein